jgi:hypothetical protein
MALSYLTGLPGLALLGYLSVKLSEPMIIGIGGPVVFGLGVYLAGQS